MNDIRPLGGSQHDAFEELVCQIVRRTDAAGQTSWRKLHGAGGDGGVEALWLDASGAKIAVQAKFFLRMEDSSWPQLRKSFETAVRVHADLSTYIVYLACDLTGPTGRGHRNGLDKWEAFEVWCRETAASTGRTIALELRTASDVRDALADLRCVGLAAFWFGQLEITQAKLDGWLASAARRLGERYRPDDHVAISTMDTLRGLVRAQEVAEPIDEMCRAIAEATISVTGDLADQRGLADAGAALFREQGQLVASLRDLPTEPDEPWDHEAVRVRHRACRDALDALQVIADRERPDEDGPELKRSIDYLRYSARKLRGLLFDLSALLHSGQMQAEEKRCLLITGEAGSGKSHLLAAFATETCARGGAAILVPANALRDREPWASIAEYLGLARSDRDEVLGALDAYASSVGQRAVLLIDALNEGPLRGAWQSDLEDFLSSVLAFSHLTVAVSCRTEYVERTIPSTVRTSILTIRVRGFLTTEELEAAAEVYLDRRGIARPSVPWVAPELTNPLFLSAVSDALAATNQTTFPVGMNGTMRILRFYLEAVAIRLASRYELPKRPIAAVLRAVRSIAGRMADGQTDYVALSESNSLLEQAFEGVHQPDHGWQQALLDEGLFREDPDPIVDPEHDDPLDPPDDVLRFAYERFQHHLMVDAMLEDLSDPDALFEVRGPASFLLREDRKLTYRHPGIVNALSIAIPERFGQELVDVLPGDPDDHWDWFGVQDAFLESVRWREAKAIGDRARELFDCLRYTSYDHVALLIELAPRPEHPWNIDFLSERLHPSTMAERDGWWTRAINQAPQHDGSPIMRLLDWAEHAPKATAEPEVVRLCATTLVWLLTSSARTVRDRAIKGLAALFHGQPDLFPTLLGQFHDVDDPYLIEGLLGAGYGALLRRPTADHAASAAEATIQTVFDDKPTAEGMRIRGYASGILQVADALGVLPPKTPQHALAGPYGSYAPRLDVIEDEVKQAGKKAGGDEIYRSCTGMEDFARYVIQRSVEDFTLDSRSSPEPTPSPQARAEAFEDELDHDAYNAIVTLGEALRRGRTFVFDDTPGPSRMWGNTISHTDEPEWLAEVDELERALLRSVGTAVYERCKTEWYPSNDPRLEGEQEHKAEKVDVVRLQNLVGLEAYACGWRRDLHGDEYDGFYDRGRPATERIGKKYQRIALEKVLCRLADNYWLSTWNDAVVPPTPAAMRYTVSDVDPSTFALPNPGQEALNAVGVAASQMQMKDAGPQGRFAWVTADANQDVLAGPVVRSEGDEDWVVADAMISAREVPPVDVEESRWDRTPWLREEWVHVHTALVEADKLVAFAASLRADDSFGTNDFQPDDVTNERFLYEGWLAEGGVAGERPHIAWRGPARFRYQKLVENYVWERDQDLSLSQDGYSRRRLNRWITNSTDLRLDPHDPAITVGEGGSPVALSDTDCLLVRRDWLQAFLEQRNLACLWLNVGERDAMGPGWQKGNRCWRRFFRLRDALTGEALTEDWYRDN